MAKLLLFVKEGTDNEYVVIQEDTDVPIEDYAEPGYTLHATVEIAGDPYQFPTERSLRTS